MTRKQYIPEEKQQAIERERARYSVRPMVGSDGRPDVSVRTGCVVCPRGFILDAWIDPPENLIVDDCDLCAEILPARECSGDDMPKRKIGGKCFFAGYMRRIWGHFLMNSTARLWYPLMLLEAGNLPADAKIVFAVARDEDSGFWNEGNYAEFFRLAGIADKVVVINEPTEFDCLVVPALGFNLQTHISPEWCAIFKNVRRVALDTTPPDYSAPKKIFFTRSAWYSRIRKEIGIDLADDYFARNGYAVVHPEQLSLSRMIRMLDGAEEIAFPSGSSAHNVLLAREGTPTVIIEKMPTTTIFQEPANLASGIAPIYIEGALFMRPVRQDMGPFMYYYTDFWRQFTDDRGGSHPDGKYLGDADVKKRLRAFFRSYRRIYKRTISFDMYMLPEAQLYFLALERANDALRPWLLGEEALYLSDYLDPYFWARRIKRLPGR